MFVYTSGALLSEMAPRGTTTSCVSFASIKRKYNILKKTSEAHYIQPVPVSIVTQCA